MSEMDQDTPIAVASPPENQFLSNGTGGGAAGPSGSHANGVGSSSAAGPSGTGSTAEAAIAPAPDLNAMFAARREEEMARRDRSLAEFLVMLDGYKPLIPEEVTEYYLQRSGFECSDPRLKRLLSLSAQKFISDLSRDAFHFAKLRVNGQTAGRGRPTGVSSLRLYFSEVRENGTGIRADAQDKNRVVLTMEDLSLALAEHGVNVKKPDYYL